MCAFRFHFRGRKVNWNQASHVRASSVLYRHSAIQYCNHWMMTVILWKCLNSESYVAIVFAPSACRIGWRFSLMWHFSCAAQLSVTGSLALPDPIVWAPCAVPPLGTALLQTESVDPTSILTTGLSPAFSEYDYGCLEKRMWEKSEEAAVVYSSPI